MNTDELLRNTYKLINNKITSFTTEETNDRRRLLRRILKRSQFNACTDEQLDNMTAQQIPGEGYVINDTNGYEWKI